MVHFITVITYDPVSQVLEAIRVQYLGQKKQKKKVLKPSEKFKFSFDWDMNDDTSRDLNPLYQVP